MPGLSTTALHKSLKHSRGVALTAFTVLGSNWTLQKSLLGSWGSSKLVDVAKELQFFHNRVSTSVKEGVLRAWCAVVGDASIGGLPSGAIRCIGTRAVMLWGCVVDMSASIDTCATGQESPVSVSWTIGAGLGAGTGGALGFFAMPEVLRPFGAFFFTT